MRNWRFVMEVHSREWLCLFRLSNCLKVFYFLLWAPQVIDITNLHSSFLKNSFFILRNFIKSNEFLPN